MKKDINALQKCSLHFLDSFKLMSSSLDNLIKNIPDENKAFFKSLAATQDIFELKNKGDIFHMNDLITSINYQSQNLKTNISIID